jgi:nudix motif 8
MALVNSYTSPALAAALRDREHTLKLAAQLLNMENLDELKQILSPYDSEVKAKKRLSASRVKHLSQACVPFNTKRRNAIRTTLHRLPRHVPHASEKRAAVVIPLCHHKGEPCIMLTLRSDKIKFGRQVCFPGGFVSKSDSSVVDTCLREMSEEVHNHWIL